MTTDPASPTIPFAGPAMNSGIAAPASSPAAAILEAAIVEDVVGDCRRLFGRALAGWARDVLALRRAGLHKLCWLEPASSQSDADGSFDELEAAFD